MMKRVVVKVGSSSIVNKDLSVNKKVMLSLMKSFYELKDDVQVALVTSGAIALGMHELSLNKKPSVMALKQACAAIGQAKLMEEYNKAANYYELVAGQILVSHDDFQVRKRMVYLSNTLDEMFKHGIIPIINENDALAVEEIKVGDNDSMAALIAPMIHADLVILFSDVDGLFDKNPKVYNDAKLIETVNEINDVILACAGLSTTNVGTGGMETKISAAKMATQSGTDLIICNSKDIDKLKDIINGAKIGTRFIKNKEAISSRDHWIIYKTNTAGKIIVDNGCKDALKNKKVSILAKGVVGVEGAFLEDSVVEVVDANGEKLGKGITKYSSMEIDNIKGLSNKEILEKENKARAEIIHANDLVLFK